jgi:hypothetical protein
VETKKEELTGINYTLDRMEQHITALQAKNFPVSKSQANRDHKFLEHDMPKMRKKLEN